MKALKHIPLLLAVITAVFFMSCKKEPLSPSLAKSEAEAVSSKPIKSIAYCGNVSVVDLKVDKVTKVGSLIVSNNLQNLYVTYKTDRGYSLNSVQLFVGDYRVMPRTKEGSLNFNQFPYIQKFSVPVQEYTFIIPLSLVRGCFKVAAHSTILKRGEVMVESAWADGISVNPEENHGMYFENCKQLCGDYEL